MYVTLRDEWVVATDPFLLMTVPQLSIDLL